MKNQIIKTYCLGFAFNGDKNTNTNDVLLIKKLKPKEQRGKWNGLGGKIFLAESPHWAMAREFAEESGIDTRPSEWTRFALLSGKDAKTGGAWEVYCFYIVTSEVWNAKQLTKERIECWSVETLPQVVSNVPALIALAIAKINKQDNYKFAHIQY